VSRRVTVVLYLAEAPLTEPHRDGGYARRSRTLVVRALTNLRCARAQVAGLPHWR
jgi:hypothetical protein